MLKIAKETDKAVMVETKAGLNEWLPKSAIRVSEDGVYVAAVKKFALFGKKIDKDELEIDETINMRVKVSGDRDAEIRVAKGTGFKSIKRKAAVRKKYGIYIFVVDNDLFAIPKIDDEWFTNKNGLVYVGNADDEDAIKNKFGKKTQFAKLEEIKKEIEKNAMLETDWSKPVKHKEYDTILSCVEMNVPVYLYGPAGSGKNHVLMGVAKELGLEFYFTNSVQQEFKLTGFIDAGGVYHETEFYKAFVNGGLFFLDEMDASIPEVLVLLNAAIANGYFEFPNGKVFANEDFRVVAAGNTIGSGADEQYTGRLVLDQATLDRFVSIKFDYDKNIELALAKGDSDLVDFIEQLREKALNNGVRCTFSYRCIMSVKKLEDKLPMNKIMLIAVFKGMDMDTLNTLKTYGTSNKYFKIMEGLVA